MVSVRCNTSKFDNLNGIRNLVVISRRNGICLADNTMS